MKYEFSDDMGQARAAQHVGVYPRNGKRMVMELREVSEKRRDVQNRLLWKWNGEIQAWMAEHTGQIASAEDWHDVMCRQLRPVTGSTLSLPGGDAYTVDRWRSSKAGVKEMAAYLTDLDRYCSSLGLLLSHPDDMYREAVAARAA